VVHWRNAWGTALVGGTALVLVLAVVAKTTTMVVVVHTSRPMLSLVHAAVLVLVIGGFIVGLICTPRTHFIFVITLRDTPITHFCLIYITTTPS